MWFCVITEVPDPEKEAGNLAAPLLYVPQDRYSVGPSLDPKVLNSARMIALLHLRSEVFDLGEILVMGEDGREVGGAGRKPSKWDVSTESFNKVEDAVARSREVMQAKWDEMKAKI